jgi:sec-independent protein translocase protein TatB
VFNLSGSELVLILLLALVVLGPEKLPEAIRRFGRLYGELKRMSTGFQSEFRSAFDEPMRELRETAQLTREAVQQATSTVEESPDAMLDSQPSTGAHPGSDVEHPPVVGDRADSSDSSTDSGSESDPR